MRFLALVCTSVTFAALATVSLGTEPARTKRDAWYTGFPEREDPFLTWKPVPGDRFFPVDSSMSSEAETLLREVSFVPISTAQASQFVKTPLSPRAGLQPYLLRGVLFNERTGGFSLYSSKQRLLVSHNSLGRSPVPMVRRPLVAYLPEAPSELFVVCGMDE